MKIVTYTVDCRGREAFYHSKFFKQGAMGRPSNLETKFNLEIKPIYKLFSEI